MSIETEFQSTIQNVQNAYNGLNNLGATIPQNKTIENIKSCLDEIYDRLPKTEFEEGESVTLENTLKGKLDFQDGKVGFGRASQESTKGYNIVNTSNFATTTINGVTCTNNGDGTFTINGTATADTNFNLINGNNVVNWNAGTYKLLGQPSGDSGWDKFILYFNNWDGINCYSGQTKTLSSATTSLSLIIRIGNGKTYNNLTFFPMITTNTSLTNDDCEQYTGGQASPNPSYPQEIKYVRGKNRLNLENCTKLGNATRTNETSNSVELTGVGAWSNGTYIFPSFAMNTNLRISLKLKSSVARTTGITIYGTNTNDTSGLTSINEDTSSLTANIEKEYSVIFNSGNYKYICMRIWTNYSTTTLDRAILEATEIMLLEGSQATPYLPYNTIEEVVSGKNKFNGIYVNALTGGASPYPYTENNDCRSGIIKVEPNTTYTISKSTSNRFRISEYSTQPQVGVNATNYIQAGDSTTQYTLTTQSTTTYLLVQVTNEGQDNVQIQVEQGSTATTYEPYITPTSYQLSLGDIELNAIGNYKDELIYDVENDKVYKNETIGEYLLTGQETIYKDTPNNRFELDNLVDCLHLQARSQIYCNRYPFLASGNADYGMFTYWNGAITQVFVYDKDQQYPSNLQNYFANNETYFCYIRNTPILKELTDTTLINQVKALYNAHSNNGTTIITSNGDLPMIIKVRGLKGE